jgi:ribosomal protein S6--L-glutamate ligase
MIVSFHPAYEADRNVICAGRSPNASDLAHIRQAKAVILNQGCPQRLYDLARAHCRYVFPNYDIRFQYPGKLGQIRLFRKLDIPYPATELFDSVESYRHLANPGVVFPLVFKFGWGGEGETVFLIRNAAQLEDILKKATAFERTGQKGFLLQEFIPSDGRSLRVVIIGKRAIAYWRTRNSDDGFKSNLAQGATIDTDSDPELQRQGIQLVRSFCRRTQVDLAGFDLLFPSESSTPEALMLELNYFFGRRGLGGSQAFYRILKAEIDHWLQGQGLT